MFDYFSQAILRETSRFQNRYLVDYSPQPFATIGGVFGQGPFFLHDSSILFFKSSFCAHSLFLPAAEMSFETQSVSPGFSQSSVSSCRAQRAICQRMRSPRTGHFLASARGEVRKSASTRMVLIPFAYGRREERVNGKRLSCFSGTEEPRQSFCTVHRGMISG